MKEIKGFITQHEGSEPTLALNKFPPSLTFTAIKAVGLADGVYDIVASLPIFEDLKTHFYIAPQSCLADLSSGQAYGSRLNDTTIRIVNWNYPSGLPTPELNSLCFTIEIYETVV